MAKWTAFPYDAPDLDAAAVKKQWARLHAGDIDSFKAEKRYLRKDGTPLWVHITVRARRGADGRPAHRRLRTRL